MRTKVMWCLAGILSGAMVFSSCLCDDSKIDFRVGEGRTCQHDLDCISGLVCAESVCSIADGGTSEDAGDGGPDSGAGGDAGAGDDVGVGDVDGSAGDVGSAIDAGGIDGEAGYDAQGEDGAGTDDGGALDSGISDGGTPDGGHPYGMFICSNALTLDFGVVTTGCSSQNVTVELGVNGMRSANVTKIEVLQIKDLVVFLLLAAPPTPFAIGPNRCVQIKLKYRPLKARVDTAVLRIYTDAPNAINGVIDVPMTGEGTTDSSVEDSYTQGTAGYHLSRQADPGTIVVTVNGVQVPDDPMNGYSYDPGTNSIVFGSAAVPPAGATIDVTYDAECY